MRSCARLFLATVALTLVSAAPGDPPRPLVIPFDFESKFDDGTYGQQLGDMFWTKIKRQGGFVLPEAMQEVREWCERNHFTPGPDTPIEKVRDAVRKEQAGDIGIWGKVERVAGHETDVYDLWITIADFSTEPPRIIYQKQGRTKTVSEIPHVYVKEAMEALTGKVLTPFPTKENSPPKGGSKGLSLVRGDFEDGRASPLGWDPKPPLVSVKAEPGKAGANHYLHFNIPQSEAESTGVLYYSDFFPVEAGKTYRFQCRWRTSGSTVKVFVKCYDEFATNFARDGGNPAAPEKREVYRSQQNLTGPSNTWNEQVEEFTPKHSKFKPKWGRVMLYGYFPAGSVDWDDVSVTRVSPRASDEEPKR